MFLELHKSTFTWLRMGYVKRMRRHRTYPGNDSYAPVHDLRSGKIVKGYRFVDTKTCIRVDIIDVDRTRDRTEFVSNIGAAWDIYEEELVKSVVEF